MKNKKKIIYILVAFTIVFSGAFIFKENKNAKADDNKIVKSEASAINAVYKEGRMYPMVNIINDAESFNLKIDGIEKSNKVRIVNPKNGESIDVNDGNITLNNVIEKDIDYGILLDDDLIGIIRAVNNKDEIDEEALTEEIYNSLKCAL
ncbi:MAG: hypothetical protein ACRCVJ_06320 [Clostridium sp.]|uniref:hypothetical protein n=1 Tax=Clostridium sp. TaxID=1506 RepID=UPI003F2AA417